MCISNNQASKFILWLKRIYHRYSLSHVLLFSSYLTFIIVCATIFFVLESVNSQKFHRAWKHKLAEDRNMFIKDELLPEIFNNTKLLLYIHGQKAQYLTNIINSRLEIYESQLKLKPPMPDLRCTYTNSILFVFSTVTTIGYGYIYPVTYYGRIFSILCSLFGIPFTIVVVKDVAYLMAKLLDFPCILIEKLWAIFRFCTLKPLREEELEKKLKSSHATHDDYRLANQDRLLSIPITIAVLAVIGWTCLGCLIVHLHLPYIETSVAFYFIFNSLTTIGVGDIEPGENPFILLLLLLYTLFGLAIVSLFMNLVHAKFSRAYWMPERMYIPLRTNLVMGEHLATFDSYNELVLRDSPLNHLVTIGVLQTEEKCQLMNIVRQETAIIDSCTQTRETVPHCYKPSSSRNSPGPVLLPAVHTSHEDVNSLIVETYGARPARLLRNMM